MTLHDELLDEAIHLLSLDDPPQTQARLRRIVSTAYYALYHLLVHEATAMFASDEALRFLVGRAFVHSEMRSASRSFASSELPKEMKEVWPGEIPKQLQSVAKAFQDLQTERHHADYKLNHTLKASDVRKHVTRVQRAFQDWHSVKTQAIARVYLASLLLGKKWKHDEK